VRRKLPQEAASHLLDLVGRLETLADVDEIMTIAKC